MTFTLCTGLKDPEIAAIIATAGISKPSIGTEITLHNDNNLKEIINHVSKINHVNGRSQDDKRSIIESIFVSCASSSKSNNNKPSQLSIIEHFKLADTARKRNLNKERDKRNLLCSSTNKNAEIYWSHVKHRKKYEKVSEPIKRKN